MQSANKAFWREILVCRSKDVPWALKCRRLLDHVYSVFSFESENWSWTIHTMDRIKRWETEMTMCLFCFKSLKDETSIQDAAKRSPAPFFPPMADGFVVPRPSDWSKHRQMSKKTKQMSVPKARFRRQTSKLGVYSSVFKRFRF